jgi:protein-S-isoprenylcysteine O-methyltransferase Ste14
MVDIVAAVLLAAGGVCFAAFSWGVKAHFRQTGRIPAGTYLISALTLTGFLWFAWRIVTGGPAVTWQPALALYVLSMTLFVWTVSATRKTPPTLAFDTDTPAFLLRHGPYQYVRHPFYAAYLLFWLGTALASPGLLPWLAPLVMLGVYWHAARREERKFASSTLASDYQRYRSKTGMFIPRLRANPAQD